MAGSKSLRFDLLVDTAQFGRKLKEADNATGRFAKSASHHFKETAKGAALSAGGFIGLSTAAFGVEKAIGGSIEAATKAEKAQASLRAQLKASGVSWEAHREEIEKTIEATSQMAGISGPELEGAFTNMVRGSGSVTKSLKELTLVSDISRAKNLDVAKAGQLVGKVMAGNTTALTRYGIILKPVTTAQDALRESTKHATVEQTRAAKEADKTASAQGALATLQKRFGGQAEAYGKTTAGSVDRMHVAFERLGEKVGKVLAPALKSAAEHITKFITGMQDGTGAGGKFAKALDDIYQKAKPVIQFLKDHPKVIAVAIGAWAAYKVAAKVASTAFNVAQFKANLAKTIPIAGAEGGLSGRAYATEFQVASASGLTAAGKGGRMATAMRGMGRALGLIGAAALAYQFRSQISNVVSDFIHEVTTRVKSATSSKNLSGFAKGASNFFTGNDAQNIRNRLNQHNGSSGPASINLGTGGSNTVGGFPKKTSPIKAPNGGRPKAGTASVGGGGVGHVMASASSGPPPRKAVYNHSELMALWVWAGGPSSVADTAAAIALAESGGHANIVNSIGATGLWQIYNGNGEVPGARDPYTNARMAVAKYRGAGNRFTPWTTFTGADTPGHVPTYTAYLTGGSAAPGGSYGGGGGSSASSGRSRAQARARRQHAAQLGFARSQAQQQAAHAQALRGEIKATIGTPQDQFDIEGANADIAEAQGHTDVATFIRVVSLRKQLARVNKALKAKGLKPAKKAALLQQKAQILQGIGSAQDTYASSLPDPAASGTDPNQALIDSNTALTNALAARADAEASLATELKRDNDIRQAFGASQAATFIQGLGDFWSNQIGGNIDAASRTPSFPGGLVRY